MNQIINPLQQIFGIMSSTESDDDLTHKFDNLTTKESSKKKRRKPAEHQFASLQLLRQISGKSETEIRTLLYKSELLSPSHENYSKIVEYVKNGQEHGFGIEIVNVIRIVRNNDFEFQHEHKHASSSISSSNFRMMLWHGTKKHCVSAILSNGFIRPPNKQQMFGVGLYFADRASKSANYCDGTSPGTLGYMLLCDVKLGRMFKAKNPHQEYLTPPKGYDTVKCVGKNIPDWGHNKDIDGAIIPLGPTKQNVRFDSFSVNYNEYVVYNPERIKAKYLVEVKFRPNKC